jgi:hypothetical protein
MGPNTVVVIKDSEGNVIERGRYSGRANGDRGHYRFKKKGGEYGENIIVEVALEDGTTIRQNIANPSRRVEETSQGLSESTGANKVKGQAMLDSVGSSLTLGQSVNIERPRASAKIKQHQAQQQQGQQQYQFKSPMNTLETMRSVSNIIVGSSKSFDTILRTRAQQQQTIQSTMPQVNVEEKEQEPVVMTVPGYNVEG